MLLHLDKFPLLQEGSWKILWLGWITSPGVFGRSELHKGNVWFLCFVNSADVSSTEKYFVKIMVDLEKHTDAHILKT